MCQKQSSRSHTKSFPRNHPLPSVSFPRAREGAPPQAYETFDLGVPRTILRELPRSLPRNYPVASISFRSAREGAPSPAYETSDLAMPKTILQRLPRSPPRGSNSSSSCSCSSSSSSCSSSGARCFPLRGPHGLFSPKYLFIQIASASAPPPLQPATSSQQPSQLQAQLRRSL